MLSLLDGFGQQVGLVALDPFWELMDELLQCHLLNNLLWLSRVQLQPAFAVDLHQTFLIAM